MFGSVNPSKAYQQVGLETAVNSANPYQLILLLFEGAKVAIATARIYLENKQMAEKGQAISKAIDIISNGLRISLDMEKGGDLSAKLAALYEYMTARLAYANIKNDVAALDEVAGLLAEIHGAWIEIAGKVRQT